MVTRASFTGDMRQWDPVASGYLTLGMGGRGWSAPVGAAAGLALPPATLDALRSANKGGTRSVQPGWLGTALHQAGQMRLCLMHVDDFTHGALRG